MGAVVVGAEDAKSDMGTVIGIDLGTTYSCVGVFQNGKVDIISNDQGNRITPSYVSWSTDGERMVGDSAKNQATINPENTVFDVKRLIGRKFDDKTVQADMKLLPFQVVEVNEKPYIQVKMGENTRSFAPEEISAMILVKMKETAEAYLGHPVDSAVITVPAYFNDAQRQATKDAGTISGLDVKRIINEPTAAALAYGLDRRQVSKEEKNVLVFDLGGGTFDVTLLTIDNGVFEVLATSGDTHLGGEDFDQRVMQHYMKTLKSRDGVDISYDKRALQKLRREVERVKRALSSQLQTRLEIDDLVDGVDFSEPISRARFEELNLDLFKRTLDPVRRVLEDSQLSKKDVHEIVLVGGSTRIPRVQTLLRDFFDGREPSRRVNPDEAVAVGAAIQGSILSGQNHKTTEDVILVDVIPLSQGIETAGGVMANVIPRNTVMPTKKSKLFSTNQDNQHTVSIKVFEGERPLTKDNHALGKFDLTGIPAAPRGKPQIEVTFEIDSNGVLQVSANDKHAGKSNHIVISADTGRLSAEEVMQMKTDAQFFAEEDRETSRRVAAKQSLETMVYRFQQDVQSTSETSSSSLTSSEMDEVKEALSQSMEWLEGSSLSDADEYQQRLDDIQRLHSTFMESLRGAESGSAGKDSFNGEDL